MLNTFYSFTFVQTDLKSIAKNDFKEHRFVFTGKGNKRYVVNVEEHAYSVYALKFYLEEHESLGGNKYKQKTNLFDVPAIVRTCINIILHFYTKNPEASFGFIGSRSDDEKDTKSSKRFRIYKNAIHNLISPVRFVHYEHPEKDGYIMLNKSCENQIAAIEQLFHNYHPHIE